MPKRTSDFREDLLTDLADPVEAARYLNAAMDDSEQMLLVALRDVADSQQMSRVAEKAGVAREALYRMLAQNGNPTYASLMGILNALGLKIEFVPINSEQTERHIDNLAAEQQRGRYRHTIKVRSNSRRRAAGRSPKDRFRSSGKRQYKGVPAEIGATVAQPLAFAS